MVKLDNVTEGVLDVINDNKFSQTGAFNLRENGTSICHGDSEHIKIKKKTDKPGIDIYIDGKTDGEAVYIPVVLSKSGMTDLVYNDFYVEDGADVRIVAGCGRDGVQRLLHRRGLRCGHRGRLRHPQLR